MTNRLPISHFNFPVEKIKTGYYSDAYFLRTEEILNSTLEPCEGARFSGYITSDMKMLPCSFDNQELKWAVDLNEHTIQEAWDSDVFDDFRSHFRNSCRGCSRQCDCLGGCPITREIVLCTKEEKDLC